MATHVHQASYALREQAPVEDRRVGHRAVVGHWFDWCGFAFRSPAHPARRTRPARA